MTTLKYTPQKNEKPLITLETANSEITLVISGASSWGSWKVISQLKCLNLSWLTAYSTPVHSTEIYGQMESTGCQAISVKWIPATLCHSNIRNLVLIRWMSNGIKDFIYFVQHCLPLISLSLATSFPISADLLTCFGLTKHTKTQEKKN